MITIVASTPPLANSPALAAAGGASFPSLDFWANSAIVFLFGLVASKLVAIKASRAAEARRGPATSEREEDFEEDSSRPRTPELASSGKKGTGMFQTLLSAPPPGRREDNEGGRRRSLLERWGHDEHEHSPASSVTLASGAGGGVEGLTIEEEEREVQALLSIQRSELDRLRGELASAAERLARCEPTLSAKTKECAVACERIEELEFLVARLERELAGVREEHARNSALVRTLAEERDRLESALAGTDGLALTLSRARGEAMEELARAPLKETRMIERLVETGTGSSSSARAFAGILFEAMRARRIRDDDAMADSLLVSYRALVGEGEAMRRLEDDPTGDGAGARLRDDMRYFVRTLATPEGLGNSAKVREVRRLVEEFETVDALRAAVAGGDAPGMRALAERLREDVSSQRRDHKYADVLRAAEEALSALSRRDALEAAVRSRDVEALPPRLADFDFWYWGGDSQEADPLVLSEPSSSKADDMRLMGEALAVIYQHTARGRLRESRGSAERLATALRLAGAEGLEESNCLEFRLAAMELYARRLEEARSERELERILEGGGAEEDDLVPGELREACRLDPSHGDAPAMEELDDDDEKGEEEVPSQTESEATMMRRVRRGVREATSRLAALRESRALAGLEAVEDDEAALRVVQRSRDLVRRGWIPATRALAEAERAVRARYAVRDLVELLDSLASASSYASEEEAAGELAGALEIAETVGGIEGGEEALARGRRAHLEQLERLLERAGVGEHSARRSALEMGVEFAEDLALLTEGDLRQAGVARVATRKVVPRLAELGRRAAERAEARVARFEARMRGGRPSTDAI